MNKQEVIRFIRRYSCCKDIQVQYASDESGDEKFFATVDFYYDSKNDILINPILKISRKRFPTEDDTVQKSILLHELGHLANPAETKLVDREYKAHLWAYRKAESMGWVRIQRTLFEHMVVYGCSSCSVKSGNQNRYVLAARKFLKDILLGKSN